MKTNERLLQCVLLLSERTQNVISHSSAYLHRSPRGAARRWRATPGPKIRSNLVLDMDGRRIQRSRLPIGFRCAEQGAGDGLPEESRLE